ncbi:MAG: hypothetical protein NTZ20_05145 [Candidatus Levybacteria bacterium]|nr:hypothetical protein [Candidatus Levybacteria bacterium]
MAKHDDICAEELLDMLGDCDMWNGRNSALTHDEESLFTACGLGPHRFGDEYISGHNRYIIFAGNAMVGIVEE